MEMSKNFFPSNLKFLRERRKLTQQGLAKEFSLTRSKVNALESGQTKAPTISDLIKCSDFFRMSVDTILRVDLQRLGELKLRDLEAGNDVYLSGSRMRVLATTVNAENKENIEMVPLKAKAGYLAGFGGSRLFGQFTSIPPSQPAREQKVSDVSDGRGQHVARAGGSLCHRLLSFRLEIGKRNRRHYCDRHRRDQLQIDQLSCR